MRDRSRSSPLVADRRTAGPQARLHRPCSLFPAPESWGNHPCRALGCDDATRGADRVGGKRAAQSVVASRRRWDSNPSSPCPAVQRSAVHQWLELPHRLSGRRPLLTAGSRRYPLPHGPSADRAITCLQKRDRGQGVGRGCRPLPEVSDRLDVTVTIRWAPPVHPRCGTCVARPGAIGGLSCATGSAWGAPGQQEPAAAPARR
jgi:hypothetical protein